MNQLKLYDWLAAGSHTSLWQMLGVHDYKDLMDFCSITCLDLSEMSRRQKAANMACSSRNLDDFESHIHGLNKIR